jgi:hypothetical protein
MPSPINGFMDNLDEKWITMSAGYL